MGRTCLPDVTSEHVSTEACHVQHQARDSIVEWTAVRARLGGCATCMPTRGASLMDLQQSAIRQAQLGSYCGAVCMCTESAWLPMVMEDAGSKQGGVGAQMGANMAEECMILCCQA